MSASREKKQRQDTPGDLTPRQRRDLDEARKGKRNKVIYSILAVVIVVAVTALLVWDSDLFRGDPVAATVNGKEYTASQVSYYYGNARQQQMQYADIYRQLGMVAYDSTTPDDQQIQDESTGKTFAQFFADETLTQLKQVTLLTDQAAAEGYVLSDEGKENVQNGLRNFKSYAAQSGMAYASYLTAMFGDFMDQKTLETELSRAMLADEFQQHKTQSFTYSDQEIETYYKDNASTMDTYEYRYAHISGAPAEKTDANGAAVEATDAEKAAAMSQAKLKADAMAGELDRGADFNASAAKYVSDEDKTSFQSDPTYNHKTGDLGSALSGLSYGTWLTNTETPRKAGDIGVVEDADSYYVVQLVNRWRAEDTYATVDARHILIKAELTEGAEAPTDEQYAAAQAKIEALKAQWESGAKTTESFGDLAKANTADEGSKADGGLIKDITNGQTVAEFDKFLFTPGRQVGDVGVVKNTGSGMQGYHLIYIDALGEIAWKGTARGTLQSTAYSAWLTGIEATYEAVAVPEGMSALAK